MSKKPLHLILTIGMCLSALAVGADQSGMRLSPIYVQTVSRCSRASHDGRFKSEVRAVWEGFSFHTVRDSATQALQVVGMNPLAVAMIIQNRGLTEQTSQTLNAPEFYLALNDCYGDKQGLKHSYIAGLIASDVAGKVAVAGATVATGWVTVKLIGVATAAYPMMRTGLYASSVAFSGYQTYRAIHETYRQPTAAETKAGREMVSTPISKNENSVASAEDFVRMNIIDLKRQLPTTQGEARLRLLRKIVSQSSYLDQMQALDHSQINRKAHS